MSQAPLLQLTSSGLWCSRGEFFIDPCRPVALAVVTHAHRDHARPGSRRYLTASPGAGLLRSRVGPRAEIQTLRYGETLDVHGVRVSLHPAGHMLGSAQVRVECEGEVWVVSGDYKTTADPTCAEFEPVRCHTFVTESTFSHPRFVWPNPASVYEDLRRWWRLNQGAGRTSLLYVYALGKAQRLLAELGPPPGPVFVHPFIEEGNAAYRAAGVALPATAALDATTEADWRGGLVLAPPTARGSAWLRRFRSAAQGLASGWMIDAATAARRGVERGFVLSDHADWPGLLAAAQATGAERVYTVHGAGELLVEELRRRGIDSTAFPEVSPKTAG